VPLRPAGAGSGTPGYEAGPGHNPRLNPRFPDPVTIATPWTAATGTLRQTSTGRQANLILLSRAPNRSVQWHARPWYEPRPPRRESIGPLAPENPGGRHDGT
jgi:hypothetical protein